MSGTQAMERRERNQSLSKQTFIYALWRCQNSGISEGTVDDFRLPSEDGGCIRTIKSWLINCDTHNLHAPFAQSSIRTRKLKLLQLSVTSELATRVNSFQRNQDLEAIFYLLTLVSWFRHHRNMVTCSFVAYTNKVAVKLVHVLAYSTDISSCKCSHHSKLAGKI